jgi:hypothetical protein
MAELCTDHPLKGCQGHRCCGHKPENDPNKVPDGGVFLREGRRYLLVLRPALPVDITFSNAYLRSRPDDQPITNGESGPSAVEFTQSRREVSRKQPLMRTSRAELASTRWPTPSRVQTKAAAWLALVGTYPQLYGGIRWGISRMSR